MTSRQFGLIGKSIWHSRRFRALQDPIAKLIYLYFHTNEHRNSIGCYQIRKVYALADLDISAEVYDRGIDRGIDTGLIRYDADNEIVLICDFFRLNPISNPNHAIGAVKCIDALPDSEIKGVAAETLNRHLQEKSYETRASYQYDRGIDRGIDTPIDTGIDTGMDTPTKQREHGNTLKDKICPIGSSDAYPDEFEKFWKTYHRKNDKKKPAFKAWQKAVRRAEPEEIIQAAKSYIASLSPDNRHGEFQAMASTWLNQGRFEDDYQPFSSKAITGQSKPTGFQC